MLKKLDELNVNDLRKGIDPQKRALSKAVIGKGLQEISIDGVLKFHTNAVTTHGVAYWQQWVILLSWWDAISQVDLPYIERANLAVTSGDILIRCDCPSFLFHGFAFILSSLDADANMYPDYDMNMGPETRFPKIRNPELKGVMCKHLVRTVADIMPFKISSVAKAMKEFVESGKISFSDKGTAYVTADGPPRGEKAVEKVAKPDPKDEPPKEPVKKPEPEEDPEQPDTSENTDEVKESRLVEATGTQVHENAKYKDIPRDVFNQIVLCDPLTVQVEDNPEEQKYIGPYSKWLLNLYVKGNLPLEDLYKAEEYLEVFNTRRNLLPVELRDINKFKSLPDLFDVLQANGLYQKKTRSEVKREIRQGQEEINTFYEDDEWIVVIPQTKEASIHIGQGTEWCTAARGTNNMFDYYACNGNLYVFIRKVDGNDLESWIKTTEKYQVYIGGDSDIQMADAEDKSITYYKLIEELNEGALLFLDSCFEECCIPSNGEVVVVVGASEMDDDEESFVSDAIEWIQNNQSNFWLLKVPDRRLTPDEMEEYLDNNLDAKTLSLLENVYLNRNGLSQGDSVSIQDIVGMIRGDVQLETTFEQAVRLGWKLTEIDDEDTDYYDCNEFTKQLVGLIQSNIDSDVKITLNWSDRSNRELIMAHLCNQMDEYKQELWAEGNGGISEYENEIYKRGREFLDSLDVRDFKKDTYLYKQIPLEFDESAFNTEIYDFIKYRLRESKLPISESLASARAKFGEKADEYKSLDFTPSFKYLEWICKVIEVEGVTQDEIKPVLEEWDAQLNKNQIPKENRDINKLTFVEVQEIVDSLKDVETSTQKKKQRKIKVREDSEVVWENENWTVVIPYTEEAAVYYGQSTKWCISATESENHFNRMINQGIRFFIFLPKKSENKFAISIGNKDAHVWDAEDNDIPTADLPKEIRDVVWEGNFDSYTPEQEAKVNKYKLARAVADIIERSTLNDDGTYSCQGNVDLSGFDLEELPIHFRSVSGGFTCSENKLVNLVGAPKTIGDYFMCDTNQLETLKGSPKIVRGLFTCAKNQLKDLVGGPIHVEGAYYCYSNKLISLEGAPDFVGGTFYCHFNPELSRFEQNRYLRKIGQLKDFESTPIEESVTPQKTIKAYKLFRTLKTKPGEIYPLFIGKNIPTPMGQWIDAESIPTKEFAFRPGWHSGVRPIAPHLMRKDGTMPPDRVWAEVEVPADVDWQPIVDKMPSKDLRGQVPKGGYYRFKTPKLQGGSWIISGAIKVNKLLTQEEVDEILGSSPLTEAKISGDWEQYQKELPLLKKGVDLLREIESIGGPDAKAYIVGGAIRDIITGEKAPDDIDIATNVPIEELEKHFETHDIGKNKDFGILVVNYQGDTFEIANFRQDGNYADGRRPESVEIIMDFEGDTARRDFTINAMGVDKDGNIYDYFDGQKDIQNKILRTVGNPHDRFGEDYLRMLRTVRFASRLGFEIDPDTLRAIQDTASNIQNISGERIMKELEKMADQEGPKFADALELLNQSGLLQIILPEIFELQGKEHDPQLHPEGDAYQHTLAALRQNPVKNAIINLAILFHDVGKMDTQEDGPDGKKHYYRHAERSGELVDVIADRLKVDNETRRALKFGALNHMKMHELLGMSNSKIVKLISDPNWDTLLAVAKADSAARGEELFDAGYWDEVEKKVADLKLRYEKDSSYDGIRKLINGELVMRLRPDVKPSPRLGRIITQTMDWILDNNIDVDTKFDEVEEYIRNLI